MISWIVATNDPGLLHRVLGPSLFPYYESYGDEVVVIENAESITKAYACGQSCATNLIKCYVHHDIQILDLELLRSAIIEDTTRGGMVGVIGSRSMTIPWWYGSPLLGTVEDGRHGTFHFGDGGECAVVDGMLLATRHNIAWDETWPGWHGYEYDACRQFIEKGVPNYCMFNGHTLVSHNSDSPYDLSEIDGWDVAVQWYSEKWGTGSGS